MYFDIFIPGTWAPVADPGPDQPNGVHLDGPGPMRVVVYAAVQINPGRWHCLVTAPQLAQLKADNIPHVYFGALPANEKAASGGPAHVFGSYVVEPGATVDEVKIYRPGKAKPEVVSAMLEVA